MLRLARELLGATLVARGLARLTIYPLLALASRDADAYARSPLARTTAATWRSTPAERAETFPCDSYLPDAPCVFWRAVDVDAPAPVMFRWLGQVRVAPYSYDLVDNRGRRSPRALDPSLPPLAPGQPILGFMRVVDVENDRSFTAMSDPPRAAGSISPPLMALTYRVTPTGPTTCRLVLKCGAMSRTALGALLLTVGDLVMMRRQLLTLASLASRTARAEDAARSRQA